MGSECRGNITRSQKGLDDFDTRQGYFNDTKFPTRIGSNNYPIEPVSYEEFSPYVYGELDTEPDIFFFNFGNYSGKMFFKKGDSKAIIVDQKEYLTMGYRFNQLGNMFTAYDADGYAYHFGKLETTQTYSRTMKDNINPPNLNYNRKSVGVFTNPTNPTPSTSAWYLDSIVSPLKNKISFTYVTENIYTPTSLNEEINTRIRMHIPKNEPVIYEYKYRNYIYSYSKITQQRISSISFNGGTVTFSAEKRDDLDYDLGINEPKRINRITVKNTVDNNILKDISLNYSYVSSRLFLDKITDISGTTLNSSYNFTYNKRDQLPSINSLETDYWGYYNKGELQGSVYEADFFTLPSTLVLEEGMMFQGRNKLANPQTMLFGMLTSITYPTGGISDFTYEPHQFANALPPNQFSN